MRPSAWARRLVLGLTAAGILAAILAPAASAHSGTATIACKNASEVKVTYENYQNFGSGSQTVTETVYVDGSQAAQTNFTFTGPSGGPSYVFVPVSPGSHTIKADAFSVNEHAEVVGFPVYATLTCSKPPPQQTIVGHIYLCNNGTQTTTEVPGGELEATGPQTVGPVPNPLGPTSVMAGTYTMTVTTVPSGYTLASACGTTSSSQTVVVPPGGQGVGIFYVSKTPVCTPGTKANFRWHFIANGSSGSWSSTQSGTCPGSVTIPPQTWGAQTVPVGGTFTVGYSVTTPGSSATINITNTTVTITGSCTFTVNLPDETLNVNGGGWVEEDFPVTVPQSCGTGNVSINGGHFSANIS